MPAVKRLQRFKRAKALSTPQESEQTQALALPTEPKAPVTDITKYTILVYGREKIGKTTLFSTFPGAIFFATEPGTKGLPVYEFNADNGGVKNWDIFRKGVDLLCSSEHEFKTVIIDTVDRAYDMCLDWVCANLGIEYPGTDDTGTQDFGKSWRAVKAEFLTQLHRLAQAGMGICFTSHAKEQEFKQKNTGVAYWRIFPSMGNQARSVVEAIVDLFFFADYATDKNGKPLRVLICEGDETIWAGARATVAETFPKYLPIERVNGYDVIERAFLGEYTGLDPATLMAHKATSATARQFIQKEKVKAFGDKAPSATPVRKLIKK